MYSTQNERKSVVAERFKRTLKNKIYKYMTLISKKVYIDKLDDIANKYNNTYNRTIKMKPFDVKSNKYINSSKVKIGDIARISKYENVFAKGCVPIWSEEVFVITKVKNTVPRTYVIRDLIDQEIFGSFTQKNCKKQIKKSLDLKK